MPKRLQSNSGGDYASIRQLLFLETVLKLGTSRDQGTGEIGSAGNPLVN
jgi:hypothetical protein